MRNGHVKVCRRPRSVATTLMPVRTRASLRGTADAGQGNRYASHSVFEALSVDQLPSDAEDQAPRTPSSKAGQPDTPVSRSAAKRRARKAREAKNKVSEQDTHVSFSGSEHLDGNGGKAKLFEDESHVQQDKGKARELDPPADVKEEARQLEEPALALSVLDARDVRPAAVATAVKAPDAANLRARLPPASEKEPIPSTNEVQAKAAFWKKVRDRTIFSLIMIAAFTFVLLMGPAYLILLVLVLETLVYRGITALFNIPGRNILSTRDQSEPEEDEDADQSQHTVQREELWSKTLSWYFFAVCNFFLYGESLVYYFKHIVFVDAFFLQFAQHHRFISFMLYIFGFMAFVSNLKRRNLKHQFGLFCWVHMSLMLIVMSSHFIVNNILEGIVWFWVPTSLVICNDIFAYVCGMLFGRTPLISLSPKKTVEGFVGALLVTLVFSWYWSGFFQRFQYMVCPAVSLGMNVFSNATCDVNSLFIPREAPLPSVIASALSLVVGRPVKTFGWSPFQCHALIMAAFASLVAPFGGFFASGFKRAFNIKDFGHSIPGHGGLTDRFDCQFIMGLFSYVYYSSLVRESRITVDMVMRVIITQLPLDEQTKLLNELTGFLLKRGKL